jgi:hypothetical protein
VAERLSERPLARRRGAIEQIGGQAREQAPEVAKGALGQRHDAARFRNAGRRQADVHFLRVLQRSIEREADVHRLVAP